MSRTIVAAAALCFCVGAEIPAQATSEAWSAGVAWQGPSPGDRSLGVNLGRRVSTSRMGSVRVEGAAFAVVGKPVIRACPSASGDPCDGRSVDRIGEMLAVLSIGETTSRGRGHPVVILGAGGYISRATSGSSAGRSGPSGTMAELGLGVRLPPWGAQLRMEATVRRYFGLEPDWDKPAVNLRLVRYW